MDASDSFRFLAGNFIKKETPAKMFFCEFCKIFKKIFSFDRTPLDDCLLCLSLNLRSLSNSFFYKAPPGNCLFHVQFAEFQPPDTEKSISQVLFKHLYKNEK